MKENLIWVGGGDPVERKKSYIAEMHAGCGDSQKKKKMKEILHKRKHICSSKYV